MSDEQDMRKMGGISALIPKTYWMMVIGTLALTGVGIPADSHRHGRLLLQGRDHRRRLRRPQRVRRRAFTLLVVAACFTSFYSWRLIFMTFHGKPRASHDVMHHVHESPPVMLVPLYILAVGALAAGFRLPRRLHRRGYEVFWKAALFTSPNNHVPA
jgi:NADH-quinone oxidoreductase subunit L